MIKSNISSLSRKHVFRTCNVHSYVTYIESVYIMEVFINRGLNMLGYHICIVYIYIHMLCMYWNIFKFNLHAILEKSIWL